jgi:F-type H+-transporting ATPase subunit b
MNINATLIGQSIAFFLFVWFVMQFVWPPLINALNERKKTIADGLAAAEKGEKAQEAAQAEAQVMLGDAKAQAAEIIALAQKRSGLIIDEAAVLATEKGEQIVATAQSEIEQEVVRAKEALRGQVAGLAVMGAGRILQSEIDADAHAKVLDELVAQI